MGHVKSVNLQSTNLKSKDVDGGGFEGDIDL
jgi:hypothetical protein